MAESTKKLRFFTLETDADGVTLVTFSRPPVNAFSRETYQETSATSSKSVQSDDNDARGSAHVAARIQSVGRGSGLERFRRVGL